MAILTELGIRRAKAKTTVCTLKDGRGLSLRIEPNGTKLWHFRFYWQGKQQRISLSIYPDVNLVQARQRRDDAEPSLPTASTHAPTSSNQVLLSAMTHTTLPLPNSANTGEYFEYGI